jgi:hypothetical protein
VLISTSIESHNGDDATKDGMKKWTGVEIISPTRMNWPVQMAARSKACVCGRRLPGIAGLNPFRGRY